MNTRRLGAFIKKEYLQIIRDPSSILIAAVMPLILLFIFGYGINLDNNKIKIGLVVENLGPKEESLINSFNLSPFLDVKINRNRKNFEKELISGKIRGIIVIPQDFSKDFLSKQSIAKIQILADGSEPNIASFLKGYSSGIIKTWFKQQKEYQGIDNIKNDIIDIESRYLYNPELKSRNFLIPGSIAIILTLIGTLLTSLVIAREWERGTMENIMATPISINEILLGKFISYFSLGLLSMFICTFIATVFYKVPFNGSILVLIIISSVFLSTALFQGLLISSVTKDQFLSSQLALVIAFLPSFMLSGFVFEISAMPKALQALTYIIPSRYFVSSLRVIFLTGNIWSVFFSSIFAMSIIGSIFLIIIRYKTRKNLDI